MKIISLKTAFIIFILISNYTANTQNTKNRNLTNKTIHPKCLQSIHFKKGVLFSIAPKILEFTANYKSIQIDLTKKEGEAKTQMNIYIDTVLKETLFLNPKKHTKQISKELFNVKNKKIKIELINLSNNLKLEYTLSIYGNSNSLLYGTDSPKIGSLNPNQSISLTVANSCTKKYFVIAERINGNAKCELIINGKTKKTMNTLDKKITYKLNYENKTPTITLKNIDKNKSITYKINVLTIKNKL